MAVYRVYIENIDMDVFDLIVWLDEFTPSWDFYDYHKRVLIKPYQHHLTLFKRLCTYSTKYGSTGFLMQFFNPKDEVLFKITFSENIEIFN